MEAWSPTSAISANPPLQVFDLIALEHPGAPQIQLGSPKKGIEKWIGPLANDFQIRGWCQFFLGCPHAEIY